MSPVQVATMIRSMSSGLMPPSSSACSDAFAPMSEVNSSSAAMRRSRMPVRLMIHSSVVSTMCSSSLLLSTRLGRYAPVEMMEELRRKLDSDWGRFGIVVLGDRANNTRIHLLSHGFPRDPDRVADRTRRRVAVRLDANAVHAPAAADRRIPPRWCGASPT